MAVRIERAGSGKAPGRPRGRGAPPPPSTVGQGAKNVRNNLQLLRAKQKKTFLQHFRETGNVAASCELAGASRATVFTWRNADPAFAKAWDEAWEAMVDAVEASAVKRAAGGYRRPVFQNGGKVGEEVVHETRLTTFMLVKNRQEKYGDEVGPLLRHIEVLEARLASLESKRARRLAARSTEPDDGVTPGEGSGEE